MFYPYLMASFEFLQYVYFGNTLQQYAIAFAVAFGAAIIGKILSWFVKGYLKRIALKTKTMLDDILINSIDGPLVFFSFVWGVYAGIKYLVLPVNVEGTFIIIVKILFTIAIARFLISFIDQLILYYIIPMTKKTKSDLDDHLVPFIRKFAKVFIIIIIAIMIISQLGYNITSLITGLGIGGLAIALAAQSMLGNIFGGISIIWDKPFKIGDRIRVDKYDGEVREIGMRSTRIQTLDGTIVSIPNLIISSTSLENFNALKATNENQMGTANTASTAAKSPEKMKSRKKGEKKVQEDTETNLPQDKIPRRIVSTIGVTYDTTVKKMREAQEIIKKAVKNTKGTDGESRVSFTTFADSSLTIQIIWWVQDIDNYFDVVNDVNLGIKEGLEKAKVEMAFPTRTVYNKK